MKYLAFKGMEYPTKKEDIIRYAKENCISDEIMIELEGLPDREYVNPKDVADEFLGKRSDKDNESAKASSFSRSQAADIISSLGDKREPGRDIKSIYCKELGVFFLQDIASELFGEGKPNEGMRSYICDEHGEVFLQNITEYKLGDLRCPCPGCGKSVKVSTSTKSYFCKRHGVIDFTDIKWIKEKPYCPDSNCRNLLKEKFDTTKEKFDTREE